MELELEIVSLSATDAHAVTFEALEEASVTVRVCVGAEVVKTVRAAHGSRRAQVWETRATL